jgi:hypothetical protein
MFYTYSHQKQKLLQDTSFLERALSTTQRSTCFYGRDAVRESRNETREKEATWHIRDV